MKTLYDRNAKVGWFGVTEGARPGPWPTYQDAERAAKDYCTTNPRKVCNIYQIVGSLKGAVEVVKLEDIEGDRG